MGLVFRGEVTLVTSSALMSELERILVNKFDFPEAAARAVRLELELMAELSEPSAIPPVATDPDDNAVLAAAESGAAEAIATGERHLLDLHSYADIPILTPRQLWELVEGAR